MKGKQTGRNQFSQLQLGAHFTSKYSARRKMAPPDEKTTVEHLTALGFYRTRETIKAEENSGGI